VNSSLAVLVVLVFLQAAPANLLTNGDARQGTDGWKTEGISTTTEELGGVPCFTVRWRSAFAQEVALPPEAAGMYAAIVGRGQAERVNAGPSITGLPYLYGMVIAADRKHFLGYWQGMLARPSSPGRWVQMSGDGVAPPVNEWRFHGFSGGSQASVDQLHVAGRC
jgi:hypothetical protein